MATLLTEGGNQNYTFGNRRISEQYSAVDFTRHDSLLQYSCSILYKYVTGMSSNQCGTKTKYTFFFSLELKSAFQKPHDNAQQDKSSPCVFCLLGHSSYN